MSARGARSRKAVAKDIEKKEKKAIDKGKGIDPIRRPHDAFTTGPPAASSSSRDTSAPSRSFTVSSNASRTSGSSSTNPSHGKSRLNTIPSNDSFDLNGLHRRRTSLSGSASISESSTQGKEKKKYQAKGGKETKAPRGRGGGVPVKRPTAASPAPPVFRSETSASRFSPNQKTWIDFRIWEGGDAGLPPYGGWDYDEHMQTGNVLVYFKEEQQSEDRPTPQIRCDLVTLENSGSTWLSNALLYGRIDEDEDEWTMAGSPESSHPAHTIGQPLGQRRMLSPTSPGGRSPPPFNIDQQAYFGVPANGTASRTQYYADTDHHDWAQSQPPSQQPAEVRPTHELWFTAPAHVRTPQAQRLHHVAIRNFLAILHDKPIVGTDLYEMLTTLQPEIQVMYDLDHDNHSRTSRERSVGMIIKYLSERKLDDVRNSMKTALGLLAWAEQDNVKWRQGYLESFVHIAGVLSPQMEDHPDFKRLSIVTRRNLGIAAKSLQLNVMEAEEKLSAFDFSDFWGEEMRGPGNAIYQSYTAFRQFLLHHFTRAYGSWPPTANSWLNRKIVLSLQKDFGLLYDYLVNRDIVWDPREERPGKKWQMVNNKDADFRPYAGDVDMTDLLVTFDNKHGYQHIPHPYPLLPREVPQSSSKAAPKKSFFGGLKKQKVDANKDAKAHLQLSIIYSDATNIEKMDVSFNGSTLIDAFERFELSADLKGVTPREARLGRWILLYGILQVLSTLSVDVADLKWTQGVRYFLCTDLKRCPEWVTNGQIEMLEASQQRSWCWQRPWAPTVITGIPAELEGNSLPIGSEMEAARDGATSRMFNDTTITRRSPMTPSSTQLDDDIRRISEKIENMHTSMSNMEQHNRRNYHPAYDTRKIDNEKLKREEFDMDMDMRKRMEGAYRITEQNQYYGQRDYEYERERREFEQRQQPPTVPIRSPKRSPLREAAVAGVPKPQGYFPDERTGWV